MFRDTLYTTFHGVVASLLSSPATYRQYVDLNASG